MRTRIVFLLVILSTVVSWAQNGNVGIGTSSPDASAKLEIASTTQGFLPPRMTAAQRAAISAPVAGLVVYQTDGTTGLYVYTGSVWEKLIQGAGPEFGDVKSGFQTSDHNGWIRLNNQAISSLTVAQQARAVALGFLAGGNLPDANNAYLSQTTPLRTISGDLDNTITLAQSDLPNVTLGGTAASNGAHTHSVASSDAGGWPGGLPSRFKRNMSPPNEFDVATTDRIDNTNYNDTGIIGSGGAHTHSITTNSINGNVTQTAIAIKPRTLGVNFFIYLGN